MDQAHHPQVDHLLSVEAFQVPRGMIAFTVDLTEAARATITLPSDQLDLIIAEAGEFLANWSYRSVIDNLVGQFRAVCADLDDDEEDAQQLRRLGVCLLWTALKHPTIGEALQGAIRERVAETGRAHITWRFSRSIGIALDDHFVDMAETQQFTEAFGDPDPEAATLMIAP